MIKEVIDNFSEQENKDFYRAKSTDVAWRPLCQTPDCYENSILMIKVKRGYECLSCGAIRQKDMTIIKEGAIPAKDWLISKSN
jgi:hypothetical protein